MFLHSNTHMRYMLHSKIDILMKKKVPEHSFDTNNADEVIFFPGRLNASWGLAYSLSAGKLMLECKVGLHAWLLRKRP